MGLERPGALSTASQAQPPPYSFDDVYACSPTTTKGPTPFDNDGTQSFQCVELSLRFMWAIYGVSATGIGDGADLVSDVHQQHKSISVGTPGPGSVPSAGDVASMGPGPPTNSTSGHTAVVISSNASTGQFTVMSQDWPEPDAGEQTWKIDLSGGHNGQAEIYGEWTSVSWLNLSNKTTLDLTAVFDSEKTSGQPPQEDIYWQGSNGDLWETSWVPSAGSGGTRYGPADLGIAVGSDLTAVFDSEKTSGQPPQEDIYWQGSNGDLWETSWVPSAGSGGTRYGPADLGIAVGSDLTAVFDSEKTSGQPPQEDIYWQGSNGDLWETSWVPSAGSGGTRYGPADLGIAVGSDLTAVFDSEKTSGQPPQEDIYWQGSNGDLWETSWVPSAGSGGTRYGPADLGIAVGSDLTAVFDSEKTSGQPPQEDIYWQGSNGRPLGDVVGSIRGLGGYALRACRPGHRGGLGPNCGVRFGEDQRGSRRKRTSTGRGATATSGRRRGFHPRARGGTRYGPADLGIAV
jgi:hypothetical protein